MEKDVKKCSLLTFLSRPVDLLVILTKLIMTAATRTSIFAHGEKLLCIPYFSGLCIELRPCIINLANLR